MMEALRDLPFGKDSELSAQLVRWGTVEPIYNEGTQGAQCLLISAVLPWLASTVVEKAESLQCSEPSGVVTLGCSQYYYGIVTTLLERTLGHKPFVFFCTLPYGLDLLVSLFTY